MPGVPAMQVSVSVRAMQGIVDLAPAYSLAIGIGEPFDGKRLFQEKHSLLPQSGKIDTLPSIEFTEIFRPAEGGPIRNPFPLPRSLNPALELYRLKGEQ